MHSDILNYTKLAFNSLKMIQNGSLSVNQTGDRRLLMGCVWLASVYCTYSQGRRQGGGGRGWAVVSKNKWAPLVSISPPALRLILGDILL